MCLSEITAAAATVLELKLQSKYRGRNENFSNETAVLSTSSLSGSYCDLLALSKPRSYSISCSLFSLFVIIFFFEAKATYLCK